jgi:hypothetical protein
MESSMRRLFSALAVTAIVASSFIIGGCGDSNEKASGITGKAPEDGGPKTPEEYGKKLQEQQNLKTQGYPQGRR